MGSDRSVEGWMTLALVVGIFIVFVVLWYTDQMTP